METVKTPVEEVLFYILSVPVVAVLLIAFCYLKFIELVCAAGRVKC